jgi:outer membrane protein
MGSLVFSWNLYRGGQDVAKKKQAIYQKKQMQAQQLELENKIRLQVKEAYHNLEVARKTIISTEDALKSRKEAFFIVSKKYREGMVPQIEYMKARNDFTSAGISNIIAIYDYYIKEAQLERVSAVKEFE